MDSANMKFNWNDIDTVLLDMDGTLLDRHFDDHFWLEHVPRVYARENHIPLENAQKKLYNMFRSQERTLNWTDLDYWSARLKLDIPLLKLEIDHMIKVHPFVIEFLLFLHRKEKSVYLVTNAHGKTLDLKLRKTRLGHYFSGIVSAHDVGLPKENVFFWEKLQGLVSYDPSRTMLGEDSEINLTTASLYGIRYLIYVSRSSSATPPVASTEYVSIHFFSQLIPPDDSMEILIPS
jgi:5'-nucleotidase